MWLIILLSCDSHGRAADQRIRRIGNDLIGGLESRYHLYCITVIAADCDRDQLRLPVAYDTDT